MERVEKKRNEVNAIVVEGRGEETAAASSSSVVLWERFLPKMVVRVLLVEADDSTRQVIATLLRKCCYKVAAVKDGLKAWEVLRRSSCNIDIVLTEVDLPLISGYALLSLVMENEACKNIPVIMMSSHDSVSTVYKCMLRGATDFLVMPVRKNELKNLWQHVWRRQAVSNAVGIGPTEDSIVQKRDEATAVSEDNSSRCMACVRKSKESDSQSSCTKLDSGNNGKQEVKHLNGISKPERIRRISDSNMRESRSQERNDHSGEAIDLIRMFNNHPNVAVGACASNISSKDGVPQLDLSLTRSVTDGSMNHLIPDRPQLNHSEASPFSRYVNIASGHCVEYNPEMHNQKHASLAMVQAGMGETTCFCSPNSEISYPIPVRGVTYENGVNGYDSMIPCAQEEKNSCVLDRRNSHPIDPTDKKSESPASFGRNQSGCSTLCNGNSNISSVTVIVTPSECGNEESYLVHEQRSLQREVALMKFRLKRKDRCFEKKVRYESRKKLAEQRPRVKGQFVRQVTN